MNAVIAITNNHQNINVISMTTPVKTEHKCFMVNAFISALKQDFKTLGCTYNQLNLKQQIGKMIEKKSYKSLTTIASLI